MFRYQNANVSFLVFQYGKRDVIIYIFFHEEELLMLMNNGSGTLTPLGIQFRPFANTVCATKHHKCWMCFGEDWMFKSLLTCYLYKYWMVLCILFYKPRDTSKQVNFKSAQDLWSLCSTQGLYGCWIKSSFPSCKSIWYGIRSLH